MWCEWLLLAVAELPPPRAAVLTAGCRPAWPGGTRGTGTGLGGPAFADVSGSRGGAGPVQTGRCSDVPCRVAWADEAAVAQARKDLVPFLLSVVS